MTTSTPALPPSPATPDCPACPMPTTYLVDPLTLLYIFVAQLVLASTNKIIWLISSVIYSIFCIRARKTLLGIFTKNQFFLFFSFIQSINYNSIFPFYSYIHTFTRSHTHIHTHSYYCIHFRWWLTLSLAAWGAGPHWVFLWAPSPFWLATGRILRPCWMPTRPLLTTRPSKAPLFCCSFHKRLTHFFSKNNFS